MTDTLTVQERDKLGKRNNKRLRVGGQVPAILYGHGGEPINLAVPSDQLAAAIRHGSRLVELSGAVREKALINELQWDVYGSEVVHVDFVRVSEGERVTLSVSIELRGEAPGLKEGGVVDLVLHELEIECPVTGIPEKIQVSVRDLHLDQNITAGQIDLPADVSLVTDGEVTVVTCSAPAAEAEEEIAAPAEPELIGRKAEAEEGAEAE